MAKTKTKRRYYRRTRWSANINEIDTSLSIGPTATAYGSVTLQTNPVQSTNTVAQQYTVKNIEMTYELEVSETNATILEKCQVYLMYAPQGMVISADYPYQHPEYIMAYKWLGSPNVDGQPNRNPLTIKTRMARRLQTGDGIIFLIIGTNPPTTNTGITLTIRGLVRYWTKAN